MVTLDGLFPVPRKDEKREHPMELTRGQRQENDDEGKLSIGEDKRGAEYRRLACLRVIASEHDASMRRALMKRIECTDLDTLNTVTSHPRYAPHSKISCIGKQLSTRHSQAK